jgi:hypothetical protein
MKRRILASLIVLTMAGAAMAQVGVPQDAGLTPLTSTILLNTNYANGGVETGDIAVAPNGNILAVWEDDGPGGEIFDWEAVWTMLDRNGNRLTLPVTITNSADSVGVCQNAAASLTNVTVRAFFRANGTPTPGYTGDYGGKGKLNQFGSGFAFCAGCDGIGSEIPEFLTINTDEAGGPCSSGSSPVVQLIDGSGNRDAADGGPDVKGILSYADADVEPLGSVRPGDISFLANGNFVIVGESRQVVDQAMTGQTSGNVAVYKVLSLSDGAVIHAYTNVSSSTNATDIWHGSAALPDGFAVQFNCSADGGEQIRLFDNNGNPKGPNISLAAASGVPEAGQGGKNDGGGFKSNGRDAYALFARTAKGPWVTVINADGTVRYSKPATTTNELGAYANQDRIDGAMSVDGRVVVAFDASNNDTNNLTGGRLTQGVILDPCGNPMGPAFYVGENEMGTNALSGNGQARPRVDWNGNTIAFMWASDSAGPVTKTCVVRAFTAPPPLGPKVALAGSNVNITWSGCGVLQQSSDLKTWADISPAPTSPYSPPASGMKFYRLRYF